MTGGPVRVAGLALALGGAACGEPLVVVLDLAERVPVAEREDPGRELILFGTAASERHEAEGFHPWAGGPGDRSVLARREVEVAATWDGPLPRIAILDTAPFEAIDAQSVEVALNGTSVAALSLSERRQRYRIPLPEAPQRPGENRIAFEFAKTASRADVDPASGDRGQVAAAFYAMSIGPAEDPGLEDLLRRDAPPPFGRSDVDGVPGFWQVGPSAVRFAVRLPTGAELRAAPALHVESAAAGAAVTVRVTATSEGGGGERELWRGELSASRPAAEISVGLPGRAGEVALLGLHVEGGGRLQWVDWRGPRVVGGRDETSRERGRRRADALLRELVDANVLLVVLDAARARQFGCYGYPRPTTPEIDRIAAEGVVFDRFFTPAVYTLAAMSAVWTAEPPDRHRTETTFSARLPEDRLTLAELLTAQGIRTAGFVANPVAGEAFGFDRGFSEFGEVFEDGGSGAGAFREALPALWDSLAPGERFFAYVHFREPHFPYDPPPPFDSRFGTGGPLSKEQRSRIEWITDVNQGRRELSEAERDHLIRLYDGNLAYADSELGRIRADLERTGLWDRTVVVVTADHGEALGEHGWIGHNVQLFEPSIRIPFVLRFPPGVGPAGTRSGALADLTDLAPTIADLLGVLGRGGSDRAFQGRSLLPVVAGAPGRDLVISRSVWDAPIYAVRDARYKLIHDTRNGASQLFDLETDPEERSDVAAARPLRALYYRQELDAWIASQRRRPRSGAAAAPSVEQCREIAALGYVNAECGATAPE